jgi:hypothetical protein
MINILPRGKICFCENVSARGENPKLPHTLAELETNFRHSLTALMQNFALRQLSCVLHGVCTNGLKMHESASRAAAGYGIKRSQREQKHSLLINGYVCKNKQTHTK